MPPAVPYTPEPVLPALPAPYTPIPVLRAEPLSAKTSAPVLVTSEARVPLAFTLPRRGRHDFLTGVRVTGPNAFVCRTATQQLNIAGPHGRWATCSAGRRAPSQTQF